jgi:maltooligosyltrehalose synthase
VVAFARRHGRGCVVPGVPRLIASLGVREGDLPCGAATWADTRVELPMFKDGAELRDVLAGRAMPVERAGMGVGALLERFPVAVLFQDASAANG